MVEVARLSPRKRCEVQLILLEPRGHHTQHDKHAKAIIFELSVHTYLTRSLDNSSSSKTVVLVLVLSYTDRAPDNTYTTRNSTQLSVIHTHDPRSTTTTITTTTAATTYTQSTTRTRRPTTDQRTKCQRSTPSQSQSHSSIINVRHPSTTSAIHRPYHNPPASRTAADTTRSIVQGETRIPRMCCA